MLACSINTMYHSHITYYVFAHNPSVFPSCSEWNPNSSFGYKVLHNRASGSCLIILLSMLTGSQSSISFLFLEDAKCTLISHAVPLIWGMSPRYRQVPPLANEISHLHKGFPWYPIYTVLFSFYLISFVFTPLSTTWYMFLLMCLFSVSPSNL